MSTGLLTSEPAGRVRAPLVWALSPLDFQDHVVLGANPELPGAVLTRCGQALPTGAVDGAARRGPACGACALVAG